MNKYVNNNIITLVECVRRGDDDIDTNTAEMITSRGQIVVVFVVFIENSLFQIGQILILITKKKAPWNFYRTAKYQIEGNQSSLTFSRIILSGKLGARGKYINGQNLWGHGFSTITYCGKTKLSFYSYLLSTICDVRCNILSQKKNSPKYALKRANYGKYFSKFDGDKFFILLTRRLNFGDFISLIICFCFSYCTGLVAINTIDALLWRRMRKF